MKRVVYFVLCFCVLLVLISGNVAGVGEDLDIKENSEGLFNFLKGLGDDFIVAPISFVVDKLGWVVGTNTFDGESNHVFSFEYWLGDAKEYFFFGIIVFLWMSIFQVFYAYGTKQRIKNPFVLKNWRLYIAFIYAFLMGIPVLNRILQFITLEFLGINWFLRSLFIAGIFSFAPYVIKEYSKYRLRMEKEDEALEEAAMDEVVKVHLRK